jgi:Fic family protein
MNCYYSNLIEGHQTLPVDIDRPLHDDYAQEPERRNLQLEARAHIDVQRMIDRGEAPSPAVSTEFILWVHREFCRRLPEALLWVENPQSGEKLQVIPGELRTRHVKIGRHAPIDPEDIPAFLARFAEAYGSRMLSKVEKVIGVAASHHRLLWIHPFLDGNGRVAWLFSHAWLRELGIGSELWAVSRGLARQVDRYKAHLAAADAPRRGDLDGRGNLTQGGLNEPVSIRSASWKACWSRRNCCAASRSGVWRKPAPDGCRAAPGRCCVKPRLQAPSRAAARPN